MEADDRSFMNPKQCSATTTTIYVDHDAHCAARNFLSNTIAPEGLHRFHSLQVTNHIRNHLRSR